MLKRVVITNYLGESMEYKIDGVEVDNPSGLIITSIEGLGPVKANVNMTTLTTTDGQLYNSARLEGRNIVIKGEFTHASSIEEARLLSYRCFPIKKKVHIVVETDNRLAETDGYVESNEPDIFSPKEGCQISILCEDATFKAVGESGITSGTFATVMPTFSFPFSNASLTDKLIKLGDILEKRETTVVYDGDYDTGMELHIDVTGDVASDISIYKDSDQTMVLHPTKISYLVPNSSPTEVPYRQCCFRYSRVNDSYRYINKIPFSIGDTNSKTFTVVYNNEVHVFGGYISGATNNDKRHYKFDGSTWTSLPDVTFDGRITTAAEWNNELHVFTTNMQHYKWDGETWTLASSLPEYMNGNPKLGVFRGYLMFFDGFTDDSDPQDIYEMGYLCYYFNQNSSSWEYLYALDIEKPYPNLAVYASDCVHFFRESVGDIEHRIFLYDERSGYMERAGEILEDNTLPSAASIVVYNGTVHAFGISSNKHYYIKLTGDYHDEYSEQWIEMPETTPYELSATNVTGSVQVLANFAYIFGSNNSSGTYTEAANNDKFVYGDEIVITTNQGKKSIKLLREGNEYNVLNIMEKNPDWFILHRGENKFVYDTVDETEDDYLSFTLYAPKLYEGV